MSSVFVGCTEASSLCEDAVNIFGRLPFRTVPFLILSAVESEKKNTLKGLWLRHVKTSIFTTRRLRVLLLADLYVG